MKFNKTNVKAWMKNNIDDHTDQKTLELDLTSITEAAAQYFDQDFYEGPLDDPDHWIWECAVELND